MFSSQYRALQLFHSFSLCTETFWFMWFSHLCHISLEIDPMNAVDSEVCANYNIPERNLAVDYFSPVFSTLRAPQIKFLSPSLHWGFGRHLRYFKPQLFAWLHTTRGKGANKYVFVVFRWTEPLNKAKLSSLIDPLTSQRAANVSVMFLTGW